MSDNKPPSSTALLVYLIGRIEELHKSHDDLKSMAISNREHIKQNNRWHIALIFGKVIGAIMANICVILGACYIALHESRIFQWISTALSWL